MDGLLDYKQQQEDEALQRMFDDYASINDINYWSDDGKGRPKPITYSYNDIRYIDDNGRGEYSATPSGWFKRNYRDEFDDYSTPLHTPPVDTMAFPAWFAEEQLKSRNREFGPREYGGFGKGKYTDAVNYALDLESHKRDPYEVESWYRDKWERNKNYFNKKADEYQRLVDNYYGNNGPVDMKLLEKRGPVTPESADEYQRFVESERAIADKYNRKLSRIHE